RRLLRNIMAHVVKQIETTNAVLDAAVATIDKVDDAHDQHDGSRRQSHCELRDKRSTRIGVGDLRSGIAGGVGKRTQPGQGLWRSGTECALHVVVRAAYTAGGCA